MSRLSKGKRCEDSSSIFFAINGHYLILSNAAITGLVDHRAQQLDTLSLVGDPRSRDGAPIIKEPSDLRAFFI
jgi:hypothetical protein